MVALLGRPVVVTLTEATRPLPLLACSILTGSRSLARTIGPSRPLSTKSSVEVAQVTALALRRTMNLLKPLQPHRTTPISPVYKVGLTLEELTGGPNRQEETWQPNCPSLGMPLRSRLKPNVLRVLALGPLTTLTAFLAQTSNMEGQLGPTTRCPAQPGIKTVKTRPDRKNKLSKTIERPTTSCPPVPLIAR